MNSWENVEVISFGCLGTLVDWEAEVRRTITGLVVDYGLEEPVKHLMAEWRSVLGELASGPWRPYPEILRAGLDETFCRYCVRLHAEEADLLSARVGRSRFTDDAMAALRRLQGRFRLAVLSNADLDVVASIVQASGVAVDEVVTANRTLRRKPSPDLFREALRRLDVPAKRVLHCSKDTAGDLVPASSLGMETARLGRSEPPGEVPFGPTHRVDSLSQMAEQLVPPA